MIETVFIRAIEVPIDEKAAAIRAAVNGPTMARFQVAPSNFASIPKSPFAYWVSDSLRAMFSKHPPFSGGGRLAASGGKTLDDFRWIRASWEVSREGERWVGYAKGGSFSPFYADIYLLLDWMHEAAALKAYLVEYRRSRGWSPNWTAELHGSEHYLRPGLTWPRRTNGLSFRAMPSGCVFGDKGPAAFVESDSAQELLALLALVNSTAFGALVAIQLARTELAQSFEVGLVQTTPIPNLPQADKQAVATLARAAWSIKRHLDTRSETSHAFLLPALLQADAVGLVDRAYSWIKFTASAEAQLISIETEINELSFRLFGISVEDRKRIEQGFVTTDEESDGEDESDDGGDDYEEEAAEVEAEPMVVSLLSWSLGAAFGRFDVRLATGERALPTEPEPFDPLPVCSPGMLTGSDGLPLAAPPEDYPLPFPIDGIVVDDPGHLRDLVGAVRSVFEKVFDDANARWHEAPYLLNVSDLRIWFARDFFEQHIKRYSKSRRKAPIYWQLATASGSYSVWIYIHRATSDTLFQILESGFLGGKLDHEKSKLDSLAQEAGANSSATARREIELQENFVGELNALKTEIARVAPLWKPNLDDGVILNFAPLWRLVPQNKSWQAECKRAWDKLVSGEYDWAHLAMHLWPERVVLKCIDDRSLAIAHGLEEVLWHEDASGTWQKQQVDETTVQKLIDERTSATVKAALKDLLSAATPAVSKGRKPKAKSSSPQSAAPKSVPTVARAPAAEAIVDEATLNAVKATIARVASGASKADVLTATGLSDADWNKAVAVLLERGDVVRSGQKRGTRYHVGTHGENR